MPSSAEQASRAIPSVDVAAVLELPEARIIDLRSPAEFAQDHLPGAVNHPLFGDAERELIGTLYKQVDRKSTRLNSSHVVISYAVFCLKKKR